MIITLKGADFSASNIGTLNTWSIIKSIGEGAMYEGPLNVLKDSSFFATVTLLEGYSVGASGISITMNGQDLGDSVYSINANIITINIAMVTGNIFIKVSTEGDVEEDPNNWGTIILNDISNATLGGGTYGAGGAMFGLQTNFITDTYISHIDFIATSGSAYKQPTEPITVGPIIIYQTSNDGTLQNEIANVSSSTSFISEAEESLGKHIYRISINNTVPAGTNISVLVNPADTKTAPTIAYATGVSTNLGPCYFGAVKSIGTKLTYNSSNYYLPCAIYGKQ